MPPRHVAPLRSCSHLRRSAGEGGIPALSRDSRTEDRRLDARGEVYSDYTGGRAVRGVAARAPTPGVLDDQVTDNTTIQVRYQARGLVVPR